LATVLGIDDVWTDASKWPDGSDTFVEAFAKGLLVIAAFHHERSLGLSEIAKRTKLSRAGVRRLTHTLIALGFIRQSGDAFALTPRVLQLGFSYLSSLSLREVAQPVIETLSRETDEVVAISVLDGANVIYVTRAEVTSVLRRGLTIGSRIPAFCTSMGRVLLAGLSPEECDANLNGSELRAWTRVTTTDPHKLSDEIELVRKQGWSFVGEELEIGACGVAVPIRDPNGNTIAAINLSTNLARHSAQDMVENFLPRLKKAREQIEQHLVM
jgi:IclR family transcriptional regulator, pca regulon regulatory protein